MANLTIRRLDPAVKEQLRVRAARQGRSMVEEARRILSEACSPPDTPNTLGGIARQLFGPEHGAELELPERLASREPPQFD